MSPKRKIPQPALTLLAFMMALGPFGDTEYTPAMPAIAQSLNTSYGMVLLTMASYLVGSSIGQLVYGPLSDRYGRRPVALIAAAILTAGGAICMLSFAIWPLIGGRLVQGFGAAAGGVIAKAAVRDSFPEDERERIYAELNAAFAMAPALGPMVGSVVVKLTNWHVNFIILTGLSALLWFCVWFFLPETKPDRNRRALQPKYLWINYKRPLRSLDFMFYAVLGGLCIGIVYTSLVAAPDLVLNVAGGGTVSIIIVAISILAGFASGAALCAWLSNHVDDFYIIAAGLVVLALGSLALLFVGLIVGKQGQLAVYLIPIAVCFVGVGLVVPVSTANAMNPFRKTAGAASSMLGFIRMGIAALGTVAMSILPLGSVYDTPIVFLALTSLAIAIFIGYVAVRGKVALSG